MVSEHSISVSDGHTAFMDSFCRGVGFVWGKGLTASGEGTGDRCSRSGARTSGRGDWGRFAGGELGSFAQKRARRVRSRRNGRAGFDSCAAFGGAGVGVLGSFETTREARGAGGLSKSGCGGEG